MHNLVVCAFVLKAYTFRCAELINPAIEAHLRQTLRSQYPKTNKQSTTIDQCLRTFRPAISPPVCVCGFWCVRSLRIACVLSDKIARVQPIQLHTDLRVPNSTETSVDAHTIFRREYQRSSLSAHTRTHTRTHLRPSSRQCVLVLCVVVAL